jgi:hypothetical protein
MKKLYWITIAVIILVIAWFFIRFIFGGSEDNWIKDEKGVWIKHGVPSDIPNYVAEQEDAIDCAGVLYNQVKSKRSEINLSSQCLGTCGDYAVDIVHVPRTFEDNLAENQCKDYPDKVKHFIELDKDGNIFRII